MTHYYHDRDPFYASEPAVVHGTPLPERQPSRMIRVVCALKGHDWRAWSYDSRNIYVWRCARCQRLANTREHP